MVTGCAARPDRADHWRIQETSGGDCCIVLCGTRFNQRAISTELVGRMLVRYAVFYASFPVLGLGNFRNVAPEQKNSYGFSGSVLRLVFFSVSDFLHQLC